MIKNKNYPIGLNGYEREDVEKPLGLIEKGVIGIVLLSAALTFILPIVLLGIQFFA